jgi:hypothetical protein
VAQLSSRWGRCSIGCAPARIPSQPTL